MAKALLGHMGGQDPALAQQNRALRARVGELEATVLRLRAENDRLAAATHDESLLTVGAIVDDREPALT